MLVSLLASFVVAVIIGGGLSVLVGFIRRITHKKTSEEDDWVRTRTYIIIVFVINLIWLLISGIAKNMR